MTEYLFICVFIHLFFIFYEITVFLTLQYGNVPFKNKSG